MKRLITILLALTLLIAIAPGVQAYSIKVARVSGYYDTNYGGGEFSINPGDSLEWVLDNYNSKALYGSGDNTAFQTFCVQTGEHIDMGVTYTASISDHTIASNVTLNLGTAWLYEQFAKGTLAGYDYTPGSSRAADARALQNSIWRLMGQSYTPSLSDEYYNLADAQLELLGYSNVLAANNLIFKVGILNVFGQDGTNKQDQLVLVPEPATLLLLGSGLLGLALYRRKNS